MLNEEQTIDHFRKNFILTDMDLISFKQLLISFSPNALSKP